MMLSHLLLEKVLKSKSKFDTVLDIGSGGGEHAQVFLKNNKKVTCIDYGNSYAYNDKKTNGCEIVIGDYLQIDFEKQFDLIWASHVLEHQINVNSFLEKIRKDLKEDGFLCITVPPAKHKMVGGHVTIWNPLLLIYNVVLAGFDCKNVAVKKYDYNISLFLRKKTITNFPDISFDRNDFDTLKKYLPDIFHQGVEGNIDELNWRE